MKINFIIIFLIFSISFFAIFMNRNLIKKLLLLGVFQSSILLFFISMGKVNGGKVPILKCLDFKSCPEVYTNPVPHVLMLTAIVVGIATLSLGLVLVIQIKNKHNTIDELELDKKIRAEGN